MVWYNFAYKNLRKNIDILGCHNALENFHFLSVSMLHSKVLNVANLRILYDVIIAGDCRDSWYLAKVQSLISRIVHVD